MAVEKAIFGIWRTAAEKYGYEEYNASVLEPAELYRQGHRPELADKEEAEIGVIEAFLPAPLDEAAMAAAVDAAVAETGAGGIKEMGKVMAALRAKHGAALDMARAGPLVKARLS